MRLLFDFVNTQHQFSGGAEYIRKVFYTLQDKIHQEALPIKIVGLVDSSIGNFAYDDLTPESLIKKGVEVADIRNKSISKILKEYNITKVFIGVAQVWAKRYDVESITCPVVCVIHDLCTEELSKANIHHYLELDDNKYLTKLVLKRLLKKTKPMKMKFVENLINKNKSAQVITVSNYSRSTIAYNFDIDMSRVKVLYSCERIFTESGTIDNSELAKLINTGRKFFLLTNANRPLKNGAKAMEAFKRYTETVDSTAILVTTGLNKRLLSNHVALPFLSETDLANAYSHCYAFIYPSYFEGFGYPPVEAMKFGRPVLSTNASSVPEILGDAPLYFSPLYSSDIYRCMTILNDHNYESYCQKSAIRYKEISQRQQKDLNTLVNIIANE